jgi:hypothetical protein
LFNPDFWVDNSSLPLRLDQLPDNIKKSMEETNMKLFLTNYFNRLNGNEFDLFRNIVSTGRLYETIIEWIKEEKGDTVPRDDVKTIIFKLFFSSNREDTSDVNHWLTVYFKNKFPQVVEVFKMIKKQYRGLNEEKQHSRLACLLQSIESEIILHRCCKRIWNEKPEQVPIFTIHDSIATTVEHQNYVERIMAEELTDCIGIAPSLSVESWLLSNVDDV